MNNWFVGGEIDQNGMDSQMAEGDSDSLGNSRSKQTITPPAKEKRRGPFFRKVCY